MSEWNRTPEEYLERYARTYCNGDMEEAKKHEVVKEVLKGKNNERSIKEF